MHDRKCDLLWQTRIIAEVSFFCSVASFYNRKFKKWHCPYCTTKPKPRDGRFDHLLSHAKDVAIRGEATWSGGSMPPSWRPWLRHDVIDDVMLCYFWFGLLNCWVTFGLLNWISLVMVCWTESLVGYASNLVAIYICLSLNLHVVYLSVMNLWLIMFRCCELWSLVLQ